MHLLKQTLRRLFSIAEIPFTAAFGAENNPFLRLGALGWYFFWIAAGTGIYLYLFFDTGITDAYDSVEYMTHQQWYAAGVMRSLHRYSSDALVVVVALHILREFAHDRLRGKRFFAWLTGVPVLWFIYVCGISGYWLVWDKLAQYIAISTAEWLDALPLFGEPIANNFLDSSTLGDRFFTLMVFIHIFAPLFMLLLMWVHVQRHAKARVNPARPLAIGTAVMLVVLSLLVPATSQGPANLDVVPATIEPDWFYLLAYPMLDVIPGGKLWLLLAGGTVLLALLPWLPPARRVPVAVVDLGNCNGCGRCVEDCPFSAITMQPRSDGSPFDTEAVVNADNCMSCGLCAGACPTATPFRRASALVPGIQLPDHDIAALREQTLQSAGGLSGDGRVLVYACAHAGAGSLRGPGTGVIEMPCVGMLPPSFIDFALSRRLVDGVVLAGCVEGDCHFRLGDEWVRQRLAGTRDPRLRDRVPRERVKLIWLAADRITRRRQQLEDFTATLRQQGRESRSAGAQDARRLLQLAFQVIAYAAFAVTIGYFSRLPAYEYAPATLAVLKVSLSHATDRVAPCVPLTPQQIADLPPNMRRQVDCERARLPLILELDVDGAAMLRIEAEPSGLWDDGPASVYERLELEPGEHRLSMRLRDSDRNEGWDYEHVQPVSLEAGRYYTVTFRPDDGGFRFR